MNILITGGGTGGHLYPGLQLAKHYNKENNKVIYVCSKNGVDKNIIQNEKELEGIKFIYGNLSGFQRQITPKNIYKNFLNIFKLIYLMRYAKKLLKKEKIDLVIGVGGYISYPFVKQAKKSKVKTLIHEQNSYPGLVNRKLGEVVDKVLISYQCSAKYFNQDKIVFSSNPRVNLTKEYLESSYKEELKLNKDKKTLLFLGGSLGAKYINDLFFKFIKTNMANDYQCVLISGLKNNEINKDIDIKDNIILQNTNMLLKYIASSELIVSRAGATTLLEIIYLNKKSLIIPSPNVVANHQYYNALEFANSDLLNIFEEKELTDEYFNKFLEEINLLKNNEKMKYNLINNQKVDSLDIFDRVIKELLKNEI